MPFAVNPFVRFRPVERDFEHTHIHAAFTCDCGKLLQVEANDTQICSCGRTWRWIVLDRLEVNELGVTPDAADR